MSFEIVCAKMNINETPFIVTMLLEDGKAAELHAEQEGSLYDLEWVYQGIVEKVDRGIGAAFVRTSRDRRVYLPLSENIYESIKPGDEFPVQIVQEQQKTKLAKATTAVSAAGSYIVADMRSPGTRGGESFYSYSKRLTKEEKASLKDKIKNWDHPRYDVLFRTKAASAPGECLEAERDRLFRALDSIMERSASRPCYSVLLRAESLQEKMIRRCPRHSVVRFITDSEEVFEAVSECCEEEDVPAELYRDGALSLCRLKDMQSILERAMSREVHLKSGGSLLIEQTEAFVCVDVNTARASAVKNGDVVSSTNREAAYEVMRQIRLRQLSGTILVDFMNKGGYAQEKELMEIMKTAARSDPVPTKIVDFTKLHICEMTRQKTYRSLKEQIYTRK